MMVRSTGENKSLTYTVNTEYAESHTYTHRLVQLVFHSLTFLPLSCVCWGHSLCQNISPLLGKEYTTPRAVHTCTHAHTWIYTSSHIQKTQDTHRCCLPLDTCLSEDKKLRGWKTFSIYCCFYACVSVPREQRDAGSRGVAATLLPRTLCSAYVRCFPGSYCWGPSLRTLTETLRRDFPADLRGPWSNKLFLTFHLQNVLLTNWCQWTAKYSFKKLLSEHSPQQAKCLRQIYLKNRRRNPVLDTTITVYR